MRNKNLLILGASGKIGKWVVQLTKERGYNITAVVRSKSSMDGIDGIKVIQGSVLDKEILEEAIEGQNYVLSCLGIQRKSPNPWSGLSSPPNLTESVIKNGLPMMEKNGVERIVVVSAAGVGDSWNRVNTLLKGIIKTSSIAKTYKDFENSEKLLEQSRIESLAVRPVGLVDEESTNQAKIVEHFSMSSKISRKDVAKWMVDALERKEKFDKPSEMIGW
ncbi:MAG: NAD(P)H-binding protein [Chitinophagales bacterium]|nr:NAD(P)H-binding protein [Chitinophagales bacterium]